MWIKKQGPRHTCVKPSLAVARPGDIWECDECGQQWKVSSTGFGGGLGFVPVFFRRRLKERSN